MTLVICPNLAIDRMIATDAVRPGGMARGRLLRVQAGGKGGNVVRALRALGGDGLLAGFAAGRGGRVIAELADEEGLELERVVTGGEARVSTVVLTDDGSVTRLYELGPEVGPADERALLELVGRHVAGPGEWAVVSGAAPPGVSPGFYAALVRAARGAGFRTLVDATGEQLAGALEERPEIVKVNLAEACSAVGEPDAHCQDERDATPEQLAEEGAELSRRLVAAGASSAVVTLGARRRDRRLRRRRLAGAHAAGRRREPGRLRRLLRRRARRSPSGAVTMPRRRSASRPAPPPPTRPRRTTATSTRRWRASWRAAPTPARGRSDGGGGRPPPLLAADHASTYTGRR